MVMMHFLFKNSSNNLCPKKSTSLKKFNSVGFYKKFTRWDANITNQEEISYLKLNKHHTI